MSKLIQLTETSTPELRDGVEVFLYPAEGDVSHVLFLFLSNRRRLRIKCKSAFVLLLRELARKQPLSVSLAHSGLKLDDETQSFIDFLGRESIIALTDPLETEMLPYEYVEQYKRQLYFFIDVLRSSQKALEVQRRIFDAHITLFGLGAIGSGILHQLCMVGFRRFSLVDYAEVDKYDIARTPYKISRDINKKKVCAARELVEGLSFAPEIRVHDVVLKTTTDLNEIIQNTSLVINAADEPYIGYTSIKLSRHVLRQKLPLFVAGGFDAHLASLGEMLIPDVSPCADCYASFFDESLKNWKPIPHPVKKREGWFGGLGSLSAFSASSAVLEILAYFMNFDGKFDELDLPGFFGPLIS